MVTRSSVHRWQGRRESNPQPAVLETAALPIELHPYGKSYWAASLFRDAARDITNNRLFDDLSDDAGADGTTAFTDSEA